MTENQTPEIDVSAAFSEAWKGFKGWWIPLCIVSAILLFSQEWLPTLVIKEFEEATVIDSFIQEYETLSNRIQSGYNPLHATTNFMDNIVILNAQPETKTLYKKIMIFFAILLLCVCSLHVIIILMSKFSVSKNKEKITKHAGKPLILLPSYLLLSIIKVPCMIIPIPGWFFYVKLYFTGFIITEKSANPFTAMAKSWKMTNGIFWPTFFIFFITLAIDFLSLITIIGFIPGTSFKYTLRASLYKQALERAESLKIKSEGPKVTTSSFAKATADKSSSKV